MRLAIIGTALATAFIVTGASAQSTPSKSNMPMGTKAFCAVNAGKAECKFDTAAACEADKKNQGENGKQISCVGRNSLR